jgi:hypothetical protein
MMFNQPTRGIPRTIRLCVKHARHSSRFVVMEAAGAWTSYALRQAGITNPITVFTNDRADYVRIPTHLTDALRLTRVYGDAHVVYDNIPRTKSIIVIHDGSNIARKTFPYLERLVSRQFRHLIIIANVSPRCGEESHKHLIHAMESLSIDHGYRKFKGRRLKSYKQCARGSAPMWPYYFEMER